MIANMNVTDIAAWWGAGIASVVLLWDVFKWWRGRATEVRITASPNMREAIPGIGLQDGTFVFVEITNVGDRTTTLTTLCGFHYSSWLHKRFNRRTQAFVIPDPSPGTLPHQLDPGQRWVGRFTQTEEIEGWSRNGRLYIGVYHSLGKNAELVRLAIPEPSDANETAGD